MYWKVYEQNLELQKLREEIKDKGKIKGKLYQFDYLKNNFSVSIFLDWLLQFIPLYLIYISLYRSLINIDVLHSSSVNIVMFILLYFSFVLGMLVINKNDTCNYYSIGCYIVYSGYLFKYVYEKFKYVRYKKHFEKFYNSGLNISIEEILNNDAEFSAEFVTYLLKLNNEVQKPLKTLDKIELSCNYIEMQIAYSPIKFSSGYIKKYMLFKELLNSVRRDSYKLTSEYTKDLNESLRELLNVFEPLEEVNNSLTKSGDLFIGKSQEKEDNLKKADIAIEDALDKLFNIENNLKRFKE